MTAAKQRRRRHNKRRTSYQRHQPSAHKEELEREAPILATIAAYVPDPAYVDGLTNLADAVVLQMFELPLGETLRLAYTVVQTHQERHTRRTMIATATEALRDHLAQLEEVVDDS